MRLGNPVGDDEVDDRLAKEGDGLRMGGGGP